MIFSSIRVTCLIQGWCGEKLDADQSKEWKGKGKHSSLHYFTVQMYKIFIFPSAIETELQVKPQKNFTFFILFEENKSFEFLYFVLASNLTQFLLFWTPPHLNVYFTILMCTWNFGYLSSWMNQSDLKYIFN